MMYVTYELDTGALVGVTPSLTTPTETQMVRLVSSDKVDMSSWNAERRQFKAEYEEAVASTKITRLSFRNRFTLSEKAAMEFASLDNPAAPTLERQKAATLRAYMADVASSTFIDLSRPDTRAGVQQLELMGLLGAGRALQILDSKVLEGEAYNGV